jgi:hypothetical protein
MKITIKLSNAPLSITIEGPDKALPHMVDLAAKSLFKLREVWLSAVECQMKLEKRTK